MEPDLRITGHRVSDVGRVGSGHGSVCQTRCLTRFWVLTCTLIVALCLQSNTISANYRRFRFRFGSRHSTTGLLISVSARNIYLLTYVLIVLMTSRRFWISRHLGYWPGRVGSRVKNPDPVPSLITHVLRRARHFVNGFVNDALLQCCAKRVAGAVAIYCADTMSDDVIGPQKRQLKSNKSIKQKHLLLYVRCVDYSG